MKRSQRILAAACMVALLFGCRADRRRTASAEPATAGAKDKDKDKGKITVVPLARGESEHSYAQALVLACRDAVRKGAGEWISSHTSVRNFQLVYDSILTRARGYVKGYDGPAKKMVGQLFAVEIRNVRVGLGQITARDWPALEHLIELVGRPDFVVLVDEKNQAIRDQTAPWIKGVVEDLIGKLGLTAIFPAAEQEAKERMYLNALMGGDKAAARGLKTVLGAWYAVRISKIDCEVQQVEVYGVKMWKATVNIAGRVISRSTGGILASKQGGGVAVNRDRATAVRMASNAAAKDLFKAFLEDLIPTWARQIDEGVEVQVWASALKFGEVRALKTYLGKVNGVNRAAIRETNAAGISVISVRGLVNAEVIADAIDKYDKIKLQPQMIGPGLVGASRAQKRPEK